MTTFVERIEQSNSNPSDPRNREVIYPDIDPESGNLATPINASKLARGFINNLSAYRPGISVQQRGLEVGLAHGYWLYGPFVTFNPLRHSAHPDLIALSSTIGLIVISTLAILLYAASHPPQPIATLTTPNPPQDFSNPHGWRVYAQGFLIGGLLGATIAYLLVANLHPIQTFF
ncbi:MAG: photosystem I reaction center subunit XI [Elainella sp. Prado103]|jgi:photosystem I subunit 11|nr:photosystem I reaction center subunit XI [Elainella sp. Prado103]